MANTLSPAEEALRDAAREYHRSPVKGKISIIARPSRCRTSATCRWRTRRAWPTPASTSRPTRRKAAEYTSRGNLVGVVTNGTAVLGLGNIGPLAAKPVMEGKGCLFKKFAGIDVFDIELAETRSRQAGRHHRRARADAGRHQPRGHQGARVLLHREEAARAHEHPGVPRRPARHGHHLRRRAAQRPRAGRQEDRRGEDRGLGRRRRRDRLPRPDGRPRRQARQHLRRRLQGRDLRRPRGRLRRVEDALCAEGHRRAHAGRRDEGRRRVPRLLGAGRGHAGHGQGAWPASRSSWRWPTPSPRSGPSWPRRCGPTASSPPAARTIRTRSTTSCASPTSSAARSTAARRKITEEMKLACVREIADLAKADISDEVAAAYPGPGAGLRPRLHHPQALRFAPDPAHRAGGGQGRRGFRRGHAADRGHGGLPRSSSTRFVYQTGMFMRPVFSAAKLASAKRVVYCRGRGRARAARRADRARRRPGQADPDRPPGRDRDAHREGRPAHQARHATSRWSTPRTIRASATTGRPTTASWAGDGVTPEAAKADGAALQHHHRRADGAPGRRRRDAVRAGRPLRQPPRASCATCSA